MAEATLAEQDAGVLKLLAGTAPVQAGPAWLSELRSEGRQTFERLGLPTRKDEAWRHTDLRGLLGLELRAIDPGDDETAGEVLKGQVFGDLGCPRFVFVNGRYSPRLSRFPESNGVEFENLAGIDKTGAVAKEHLARHVPAEENPFQALNLAALADGAVLRIPAGRVVEEPVQVVFLTLGQEGSAVHPRLLVVAEENAQVRLVETHLGGSETAYFSNAVTEIVAGENAIVDHTKLQLESPRAFHLGTVEANLGRSASVTTTTLTLNGQLVRNATGAVLAGEGAWAQLDGLYLTGDKRHIDNFTRIEHSSPNCSSREMYKGILDDYSTGVFRGRIVVAKGAQKTDSKQTNKNLLLSDHALINTKPQLEIYADDVKCTHGATIGQLDREAIFYLRARGISNEAARSMLIYAFANEVVDRLKVISLREKLESYLFDWLPMGRAVQEAF